MRNTSSPAVPAAPSTRVRPTFILTLAAIAVGCIVLALAGYVEPVVMGVVQGLGEFLPISSSAHLILVPWFFGWSGGPVDSLTFDVALHLGTLVALAIYFWRDWLDLLRAAPGALAWAFQAARGDRSRAPTLSEHLLLSIVVATVPGAVFGVLLEKLAERSLRAPLLIALTLTVMGLLLYVADRRQPERKALDQVSWRDALLIGLAQAGALIPGVSRSGVTMTMGRFLTLDRVTAARYSFLLSAPITAAAVAFKFDDMLHIPSSEIALFAIGVLLSALVGALAIGFLMAYVRRAGFGAFALYRVLLALVVVLVYLLRR